jgi:DsbC/DsbD-like thiol-disulfide interchange protein
VAILKSFAARRHIEFPMLADPDSRIIRAYHVLNEEATGMQKGMALPGYFVIDPSGVIREKFFEPRYQERFTANNVVGKLFPELAEEVTGKVEAPHIKLTLEQSDSTAFPGSRVSLIVQVQLPDGVHVYSPGVRGYKPIALALDASPAFELASVSYPQAKILYLTAIQERVPVFEGKFRVVQDIKVNASREFSDAIGKDGKNISIAGVLRYQACDSKICYLPASVPVKWKLHVRPLDRQRAPEAIRHH